MQVFSEKQISQLEAILGVKKTPGEDEKILWEKVAKYSPFFTKIPGILCICVGNSLAMNTAHKDSDIDLFIITQKNRIWTVRILFTILLTILGERKTAKYHAGKFCLSFFITEDAMDFSDISIKNDIYLAYWIQTLRPILNRKHSFERFLEKNSLLNSLPFQGKEATKKRKMQFLPLEKGKDSGWGFIFGNFVEKLLKSLFLPRTQKSFQKLGKPFGVIISDDMLKFHDQDRRKEIRDTIFSSLPLSQ